MALKPSRNWDEVCYPFIHETSVLCDFEVITDELCGHIGEIIDLMPFDDLRADLEQLQPLAFHVNGSIRGRLAVEEADVVWLQGRLSHYQMEVSTRLQGFVLPRGSAPVPQLHHARSCAKSHSCDGPGRSGRHRRAADPAEVVQHDGQCLLRDDPRDQPEARHQ